MTQRIAPNNQLPATHFIEVFGNTTCIKQSIIAFEINDIDWALNATKDSNFFKTIAIFKIRKNKLPTKHNFSK